MRLFVKMKVSSSKMTSLVILPRSRLVTDRTSFSFLAQKSRRV